MLVPPLGVTHSVSADSHDSSTRWCRTKEDDVGDGSASVDCRRRRVITAVVGVL
jgi:hypothetical protein